MIERFGKNDIFDNMGQDEDTIEYKAQHGTFERAGKDGKIQKITKKAITKVNKHGGSETKVSMYSYHFTNT